MKSKFSGSQQLKNTKRQKFVHPLIKNTQQILDQQQHRQIPSYKKFKSSNQKRTSLKYIRCSNTQLAKNQEFQVLLSPFHLQQNLSIVDQLNYCSVCGCCINPKTILSSHYEFECNICQSKSSFSGTFPQPIQTQFAYQSTSQETIKNIPKRKKLGQNCEQRYISFIIQKSQQNYSRKVHLAILSFISSLAEQAVSFAFILYDDKNIRFIDQQSCQIVIIPKMSLNDLEDLPFGFQHYFQPHNLQKANQLQKLLDIMLLDSKNLETSIMRDTIEFVNLLLTQYQDFQSLFFITTIKEISITQNIQSTLDKNQTFTRMINWYSYRTCQQIKCQNKLIKSPLLHFILSYDNRIDKKVFSFLGTHLFKIYDIQRYYCQSLKDKIYYDLHQFYERNKYHNIEINLVLPSNVELTNCCSQVQIISRKRSLMWENISMKVGNLLLDNSISFVFKSKQLKINESMRQSTKIQSFMQFQCKYGNQRKNIKIFNHTFVINEGNIMNYNELDDQCYFNLLMRQAIKKLPSAPTSKHLRNYLQQKLQGLIKVLVNDSKEENKISIPTSLRHLFMFNYMIQKTPISNSYHKKYTQQNKYFLHENLETISKRLYFRTYIIEGKAIKNIKFQESSFKDHILSFADNGEEIYATFGFDATTKDAKKLLGQDFPPEIINAGYFQLPQIQSNQIWRKAIEQIRQLNFSRFLPLRVMCYGSQQFINLIQPYLYIKEENIRSIQKLWNNS